MASAANLHHLLAAVTLPDHVWQTYTVLAVIFMTLAWVVFRSNTRRGLNQSAGLCIFLCGFWMYVTGLIYVTPDGADSYIRIAIANYGVSVACLLTILSALRFPNEGIVQLIKRCRWVWVAALFFVAGSFSPWVLPYGSTADAPKRGPLWMSYGVIQCLGGFYVLGSTIRLAVTLRGPSRFVAQLICGTCGVLLLLMGIRFLARPYLPTGVVLWSNTLMAVIIASCFAFAVLTKRIFRARAIIVSAAFHVSAVLGAFVVGHLLATYGPAAGRSGIVGQTSAMGGALLTWTSFFLLRRRVVERQARESSLRLLARLAEGRGQGRKQEPRLADVLEELLEWAGTGIGHLLVLDRGVWRGSERSLPGDDPLVQYLAPRRWVTSESLQRSWQNPSVMAAQQSLKQLAGVLAVKTARSSLGPQVMVVLGGKMNGGTYTHTEVANLQVLVDALGELVQSEAARKQGRALGRIEALELMGASIGHDFKQHLTAVKLIAQRILFSPEDRSLVERSMPVLLAETDKLSEFARRLMRLESHTEPSSESIDVGALAREVFDFVRPKAVDQKVKLEHKLAADLPMLQGDRARLRQALVNLCVNGVEAMATLEAGQPRRLTVDISWESGEWQFVVADTGPGLPESIKARVFDPFVSEGKTSGDGLGLYLVWDAVTKARGSVWHESNVPQGTRFLIRLPS